MAKKKKKENKLTLKELRERQKREIQLAEWKKLKDTKFVSEAEKESFIASSSLNAEVRENTSRKKGTEQQIRLAKSELRNYKQKNKEIRKERKQLEAEYSVTDEEGKKEILKKLEKPDLQIKDEFTLKNQLKKLEGKDFDYIVDNGFQKYKINTKDLKKVWKEGEDITLPILKKMKSDSEKAIKDYKSMIAKEKSTASPSRMKKLKRILNGLENKLNNVIQKNIEAIETGNMKVLDEENEQGDKYYSILFRVVGFSIDRIGI